MGVEYGEYEGSALCGLCGKARSKKVRVTFDDETIIACEVHFSGRKVVGQQKGFRSRDYYKGFMSAPTAREVVRLWRRPD